jgi:hypothetical protein
MRNKLAILSIIISTMSGTFNSAIAADTGVYIGGGLSKLELNGENSINFSITTGYNFHKVNFESTNLQALILVVEAQYSDSISGANDVNNYSVFAAARAYFSDQWYFKIKQGFTDFPDAILRDSDAENSHIGGGVGLGYRMHSWSVEVEYVYPNKTIHASIFEISYKYHF